MIDLDEEISNSQLDDRVDQLFLFSIGLFYDFSEICFYLPEALIDKLNLLESKIDLLKAEDNLLASFKKLIQKFKKVSEKLKDSISPKGELINQKLKELNQKYGDDWLILSRNKISSEFVIPNSQFITMNTDENFNTLMVVGWPNKRRFEKFWHTHSSNNISFLTYSFEQELFANFFSQQEALLRRISKGTGFEGLNQYLTPIIENQKEALNREKVSRVTTKEQAEKIIERIESRLAKKENQLFSDEENKESSIDCKMVFFSSGEAYAWVTENHHFYVLDSLLENPDSSKIPSRKLEDLEEGNFVLFRDKGDREIISLIAEESVGQQKYEELKERSQLWKEAIKSFSSPR